MNKLKSVVIPCTAQEFHNIVEPILSANHYVGVKLGTDWNHYYSAVTIFEDSEWMASTLKNHCNPTLMTVAELQAYHQLYTYATVHAQHVDDAVNLLRDLFTLEVDGNELRLPKNYQESAAAMLFDALIPVVFSSEPCKSKQR